MFKGNKSNAASPLTSPKLGSLRDSSEKTYLNCVYMKLVCVNTSLTTRSADSRQSDMSEDSSESGMFEMDNDEESGKCICQPGFIFPSLNIYTILTITLDDVFLDAISEIPKGSTDTLINVVDVEAARDEVRASQTTLTILS
jgi:hypothetical protein